MAEATKVPARITDISDHDPQEIMRDAVERQLHNKPERPRVQWHVSCKFKNQDHEGLVMARDENEAWALFCDHQLKAWPSPVYSMRKVRRVEEPQEETAPAPKMSAPRRSSSKGN